MVPPPDKQYGVSKQEHDRILRRIQMREALKLEFRKQISDPRIQVEGGHLFDPAVQRYVSMKATLLEQFKPTMRSFGIYVGMVLFPIGALWWYFCTERMKFERQCRNGEIPYNKRIFMFR